MPGCKNSMGVLAGAFIAVLVLPLPGAADSGADPDPTYNDVTFSRDIAPILQENCQNCHRPNSIGPMSLLTYEEVRPWASVIKQRVEGREMPPYHLDPYLGIQDVKNDWRLSEEQIAMISAWVDLGAPEGDPADLPPPAEFPDPLEWRIADQLGPPDIVIRSEPFTLHPGGGDVWWQPVVDPGFTEDLWIKGLAVRPTTLEGAQIVHHANPYIVVQNEEGQWERQSVITEYAMGKMGEILPLDAARKFPAGAKIGWDIHYYPMGETVVNDVVELGIWLHEPENRPDYEQTLRLYPLDGDLVIPPHGTAMTQGYHSYDHPIRIDSFQPHGHTRLRAKSMEVFYPETGQRELLAMVTDFDARWHHSYIFDDDSAPLIPANAVVIYTAWYDNTADNPVNPDPDVWVYRGQRTTDEMSHAWVSVTHLDQEGYDRLVKEREAKKKAQAGAAAEQ